MRQATMRLIEAVERLNMSGEIGDGMVVTLHDLAAGARLEQINARAAGIMARGGFPRHCTGGDCVLSDHFGGLGEHRGDCEFLPP